MKKLLSLLLTCLLALTTCFGLTACQPDDPTSQIPTPDVTIDDTWDGTVGTLSEEVENVFTIESAEELAAFADAVNNGTTFAGKTVKLIKNIDLDNRAWEPIGNSTNNFQGTFDGDGKTIANLNVEKEGVSNVGLFGYTTNGEVKNLRVFNATVKGRLAVGVVAGCPYTSKYTNITLKGLVKVDGMAYVGGVVGRNAYANLTNINVDVTSESYVKANSVENGNAYRTYVGGVVGFMGEGSHVVSNVTSNIDVIGSTLDVGGISGIAHYGNSFINCSSSGDVSIYSGEVSEEGDQKIYGPAEIGGIAGVWHNQTGYTVTFTGCSFTGNLSINYADETSYTQEFPNNKIVGVAYSATETGVLTIN
jgi:hypothetical protein